MFQADLHTARDAAAGTKPGVGGKIARKIDRRHDAASQCR
jgi:hypothetical protein